MNFENKIYELSLWDDGPGNEEIRRCVIASHTMSSPARAFNINLNKKTNGEKTLTFSIYAKYFDQEICDYVTNPYLGFLTNERKVKLKKEEKGQIVWYDMIIKQVSEDSSNFTYTYTAKDQHVQELAKSGFELEFDKELWYSTDTKDKLAELILDGTDWKVGQSDALLEYTKEPVFRGQLDPNIILESMLPSNWPNIELKEDSYVYVPYSEAKKTEGPYQILYYVNDVSEKAIPHLDEENVLLRKFYKNYTITQLPTNMILQTGIQGERLVQSQKNIYDKALEQYVKVYNGGNIYGFTRTEYYTPEFVESLITNGEGNFTDTSGWYNTPTGTRALVYVPEPPNWTLDTNIQSFIQVDSEDNTTCQVMNSGIFDNRGKLPGFTKGQKYRFNCNLIEGSLSRVIIAEYDTSSGYHKIKEGGQLLFDSASESSSLMTLECLETITEKQLRHKKFGIFLILSKGAKIKSCEFYRLVYKEDSEGNLIEITPGSVVGTNVENLIKTHYYYYNKNQEYTKFEDIVFDYEGYEESANYLPTMNEGCEKRRTITGKESNRFNLLQEICEQFECWLSIDVEHDATGHITSKSISFHEYVGKDNYAGFKYGINLNSIKRDIDSNQIVTKMITKDNANEFAKNGFCSIARAPSNPSGTNVIYNFDYYINQGLLDGKEVSKALYATSQNFVVNDPGAGNDDIEFIDGIGLYPKLGYITDITKTLTEEQIGVSKNLVSLKASIEVEQAKMDAAESELVIERESLRKLTKYTYEDFLKGIVPSNWSTSEEAQSYKIKIYHLTKIAEEANAYLATLNESHETFQAEYAANAEKLKYYNEQRKKIEQQFYQTYSRFIQEGSWISEEYVDDELYYLDALATGYTSSRPKISYTINVFDLADVEGYENYEFQIGDKTFVEDPEFFGWKKAGNGSMLRAPYREEVVVNELTEGIDDITKNALKVQNYKTQFDDLFQRIAAATESLQYNTGRYERSAKAVETDGSISHKALQQAVTENGLAINNAGAQTVTVDEQGVITTDKALPNKKVRIIGGGIYVTKDGGETWETGITGDGINANVITTGQLNAGEVNIMTGEVASHRWDDKGISAYQTIYDLETGSVTGVNNKNFVRFDEFGLYGIQDNAEFNARETTNGVHGIKKIQENSIFSLTQDGLTIGKDGYGLKATEDSITIGNTMKITDSGITIGEKVDENGNIITPGGFQVTAGSLKIAGWTVNKDSLSYGTLGKPGSMILSPSGVYSYKPIINGIDGEYWTIGVGSNFGVTDGGYLYATGADISGRISAKDGEIGGWTISDIALFHSGSGDNVIDDTGLFLAPRGILQQDISGQEQEVSYTIFSKGNFGITEDGILHARGAYISGTVYAEHGEVAGWKISDSKLEATTTFKDGDYYYTAYMQKYAPKYEDGSEVFNSGRTAFAVRKYKLNDNNQETEVTYPIDLQYGGTFKALKAEITGVIHAKAGGSIAGWTINNTSLSKGTVGQDASLFLSPGGRGKTWSDSSGWSTVSIGGSDAKNNWAITAGSSFGVDVNGNLYANNATIIGKITADDGGQIGGWEIIKISVSPTISNFGYYRGMALRSPEYTENGYEKERIFLTPAGVFRQQYGSSNYTYFKSWLHIMDTTTSIGNNVIKEI